MQVGIPTDYALEVGELKMFNAPAAQVGFAIRRDVCIQRVLLEVPDAARRVRDSLASFTKGRGVR